MTSADEPIDAPDPISASETDAPETNAPERALTPAAQRALAEAAERRLYAVEGARAREINGRGGPEPVRFGDWEVKGLAIDF